MRGSLHLLSCLLAASMAACSGEEEAVPVVVASEIGTNTVNSRDGRLSAEIPIDLMVSTFDRAIVATSADGSFRVYIERQDDTVPVAAALGALKDEVIGLGWSVDSEKHYDAAVQLQMTHNAKGHQAERGLWFVTKNVGDVQQVALCDGIGRDAQLDRAQQPLRTICQSIAFPSP
jgi:hypothetical protein